MWSWGNNTYGQLGLGDTANRSSPVQVGALTTWYQVAAGVTDTLATKTDGTLWSWGGNADGELGLGNIVYRSSPVQIGALTTWVRLSKMPMSRSSLALKTP
jgi:alpha-tubulin suppressor-like RCC1 family protein